MSDISAFGNIASVTNGAYSSAAASNAEALSNKIKNTSSETTEEEMMNACKGFESYFIEQVLKEMKKTVDVFKSDDEDSAMSMYKDYFTDSYLQQISDQIADKGSLGIAQQLFESMKNNYNLNITDASDKAPAEEAAKAPVTDVAAAENAASAGAVGS